MLDRTIPPPTYKIKQHKFVHPNLTIINDTIPVYTINMDIQPVIQMEIVFDSGVWYESRPGVAYFAANMLLEGTNQKDRSNIAQYIDSYGASIETKVNADTFSIILCCLTKFLEPMLDLITEIITQSTYQEDRLEHLKQLKIHSIDIDNLRLEKVAKYRLKSLIYPQPHPYGRNISKADVKEINQPELYSYYKNNLFANCRVFLSGDVGLQTIELVNKYITAEISDVLINSHPVEFPFHTPAPSTQTLDIKEGVQASICIGKILFPKSHPDFIHTLIVNTLLGGYFGSRLMKNVREKNGYTYGIRSNIIPLKHSGYIFISAQVAADQIENSHSEIVKEIQTLQTEPVCKSELKILKNYLMGVLKANTDNPIALMERFKSIYLHNLDEKYFDTLYDSIYEIGETDILNISKQYLDLDEMTCIIAK